MKIIPLSEGSFTIDHSKVFVPFDTSLDDLQQRPVGSLLVEVQPFVVVTQEDVLLFDAGLGFEQEGELQLHRNLMAAGIRPSEVTRVLMSHLHKDHSGGVARAAAPGRPATLAFPQATYYIQRRELEYAFEKESTSYVRKDLELLVGASNVQLLDGNGVLGGYIRYELTGAHCPYHQVFWVVEAEEKVFFGADVAPQLQQMKNRFVAKYDYDGKRCMELRQQWWEQGRNEGWTFLFYHDIRHPVYRMA
jgi:glyoxylase-like metal-dependent hydrolase (beta-lactamase superfamily II)